MKQVSFKKAIQLWQGIQPVSDRDRERLSRRFTIDYNYNSNHIEGKTLLREDYTVYRNLPGGMQTSYTIHSGQYKTRPNSVITRYGNRFEYASPEETPAMKQNMETFIFLLR